MKPLHAPRRGAALLVAMIILTLVATLAGGMLWQQSRAVQVEAAERARTQAQWILNGALDWARVILREDKDGNTDNLGEPWAVPLAEARLSSFLAADRDNVVNDNQGLDAFLSGSITDLQSHYNVRNLIKPAGAQQQQGAPPAAPSGPSVDRDQLAVLERLCTLAHVPTSIAQRIAEGFLAISETRQDAPLAPQTVTQLAWFGVDPNDLKRLEPYITVLPRPTPVNANTASAEVLAAILPGGLGEAQRWVQMRQLNPFGKTKNPLPQQTPPLPNLPAGGTPIDVVTSFFEVRGQVRLGDRALQERSIVQRQNRATNVVYRERVNLVSGPG